MLLPSWTPETNIAFLGVQYSHELYRHLFNLAEQLFSISSTLIKALGYYQT